MTPEWYLTLLSNPQRFWKLFYNYITTPFTDNGINATKFYEFWDTGLNHPLTPLVLTLLLLLYGSLFASGIRHRKGRAFLSRMIPS